MCYSLELADFFAARSMTSLTSFSLVRLDCLTQGEALYSVANPRQAELLLARPYDLPDECQVYDESQQAVLLKYLYKGLPNLE